MKKIVTILIAMYQRTLSLDHGMLRALFPLGVCRFYPSCSEYTKQSVERYGVAQGLAKGVWQLLHCHPFSSKKLVIRKVKQYV